MNNFNYTQDGTRLFVSANSGDDRNDGLSPEAPVRTLERAITLTKIFTSNVNLILHGHFINQRIYNLVTYTVQGDGECIIEFTNDYILTGIYVVNISFYNITFIGNLKSNLLLIGSDLSITKCLIKNVALVNSISAKYFINSEFIGCKISIYGNSFSAYGSKFFNSYVEIRFSSNVSCVNNYFNEGCLIERYANSGQSFKNSNVRCPIKIYLTEEYFESIGDFQIAYPALVSNCINVDPQFKNIAKGDFSVPIGSPMLNAGYKNGYGEHIGNVKESSPIYFEDYDTAWSAGTYPLGTKLHHTVGGIVRLYEASVETSQEPSDSDNDWEIIVELDSTLFFNGGDIKLDTGQTSGKITLIKPFDLLGARRFLKANYLGNVQFSLTDPTKNNNVPATNNPTDRVYNSYSTYNAGTSYDTGDKVEYDLGGDYGINVFRSKVDSNLGNTPTWAETVYWIRIDPEFTEDNTGNNPRRLDIEFKSGADLTELGLDTWKLHDIAKEIKVWNDYGDADPDFDLDEGNPVNDHIGYIKKRFFLFRVTLRSDY